MNILVKHYSGSHAYGTNIESSDVDFRGLFCADQISIRTPFFNIDEYEDETEEDTKYYELTNYFKLLVQNNPNIQETLWVDEKDVVFRTPAYDYLRSNREALVSSKVAFTYSGYAISQLKRIKGHNKWINNPQPEEPPKQIDYISLIHNFTPDKIFKIDLRDYQNNHRLIPFATNVFGVYQINDYQTHDGKVLNTTYEGDTHLHQHPLFIIKYNKEIYDEAKLKHEQYWKWKRERNEKRSVLEENFGYDVKHAMHLLRLLRMGKEILQTGQVIVKRPDAQELIAVRNGCMKYDELIHHAESLDKEIATLYETTKLRHHVDVKFAAKLLMELQDMCWSKQ